LNASTMPNEGTRRSVIWAL